MTNEPVRQQYRDAGVNIHAGYEVVERIRKHALSTRRLGSMAGIGAFGGAFDLGALGYQAPVLVSGTDGVGTKIKLACAQHRFDTIGIDAVAMCVNDVLTQGAEPLYFLDYIASSHIVPSEVEQMVSGVAEGCRQAGCELIGGETAEMPGMYALGEYDIAGSCTGVVEREQRLDSSRVQRGDVLIALSSNGVHSNGFSLIRSILDRRHILLTDCPLRAGVSLADELLRPTRIYVPAVLPLLRQVPVHAMAHITGGGLLENIPRMLPQGLDYQLRPNGWTVPDIFRWIACEGQVCDQEMMGVFNMGIGWVMALAPQDVCRVQQALSEPVFVIGDVI